MRPTFIAAAIGGFCVATGLIALGQGGPDAPVWLAAGLVAEVAAIGFLVSGQPRGAAPHPPPAQPLNGEQEGR